MQKCELLASSGAPASTTLFFKVVFYFFKVQVYLFFHHPFCARQVSEAVLVDAHVLILLLH